MQPFFNSPIKNQLGLILSKLIFYLGILKIELSVLGSVHHIVDGGVLGLDIEL